MGLGLETGNGVTIISLPQHDGKGLVVLPTPRQIDVSVQEIAARRE